MDAAITFPFPHVQDARAVAIAPGGEYALFVMTGSLVQVDLTTGETTTTIQDDAFNNMYGCAIAPRGAFALTTN